MSPDRWSAVLDLFHAALDRPPGERPAFVAEACGDDDALAQQVGALLEADGIDDSLLRTDGGWAERLAAEQGSMTGREIGPYRVGEELGRGGMGVVYRAHRADVGSTVAVKVLRERFPSAERLRRFLAEQQMLGRLEHPGIARLLDAGVTDDGTPFFVMEHVEGTPLTDYAAAHDLDADARLRLFLQVADAVRYAHGQLVVHRDLKPSNVLVTDTGDGPQVKLLDFGIAKLLSGDTGRAGTAPGESLTRTGERLLTPAYAAPEQVGDPAAWGAVSTRTDVYALGALLYELLTGRRPLETGDAPMPEVARRILEDAPALPSAAASRSGSSGAPVPAARLRGDLDTICRTALRKSPERRYASAEALRDDVDRVLTHRPITARTDSFAYRTAKFVRRNRTAALATAAVALLVAALTTFYTTRLADERDRAQREAVKAAEVTEFVTGLFSGAQPTDAATDTLRALTLIRRGEAQLTHLENQPAVQAQMLTVIGDIYRRLGRYTDAETVLRRATEQHTRTGPSSIPEALDTRRLLGLTLMDQSRFDESDAMLQDVLASARSHPSIAPLTLADCIQALGYVTYMRGEYEEAATLAREALQLRLRHHAPGHPDVALSQRALASALADHGKFDEAAALYREARASMETSNQGTRLIFAEITQDYASLLNDRGRHAEAERLHREALQIRRSVLGTDHPETALSYSQLALTLYRLGRYAESRDAASTALDIRMNVFGPQHTRTATALNQLANAELDLGNHERAADLLRQSAGIYAHHYGPTHQFVGIVEGNRATILDQSGRPQEALALFRDAHEILASTYGPEHWQTGYLEAKMTSPLVALGRMDEAERLLQSGYASLIGAVEPTSMMVSRMAEYGIRLYARRGPEHARAFADSLATRGVPRAPLDSLLQAHARPLSDATASGSIR